MKTGEIIKKLIDADNYVEERSKVSAVFIDFIKEFMARDYEYITEKEENYQRIIKL